MKRNFITFLGVVVIVAGIVFVRSAFEQSPKTEAEVQEAEEAKTQLEEAAAITDEAEAEAEPDVDEHAHSEGDGHGHDAEGEKMVVAQADGTETETPKAAAPAGIDSFEELSEWPAECPDVFRVKFDTSTGPYVIEVTKSWAPIGAERFYEMCKVGYFNDARYFRVIHGFMVQFGLAADPKLTAQYKSKNLQDEPVRKSNQRGKITFAKSGAPNSRTTQVFINYGDNSRLDGMGFAPFGVVIFGMEYVDKITDQYGERPSQGAITSQGNAYLNKDFPNLDYINKVTLVK